MRAFVFLGCLACTVPVFFGFKLSQCLHVIPELQSVMLVSGLCGVGRTPSVAHILCEH